MQENTATQLQALAPVETRQSRLKILFFSLSSKRQNPQMACRAQYMIPALWLWLLMEVINISKHIVGYKYSEASLHGQTFACHFVCRRISSSPLVSPRDRAVP